METAEEDGGEGPWPEQSNGSNGARSKHSALVHREYDRLASEATEGGQATTRSAGREDDHGASENREGIRTEEEGDKTPQCTLPAGT